MGSCWKKSDTKNGITVARQTFKSNDMAIIKVSLNMYRKGKSILKFVLRYIKIGPQCVLMFLLT